MNRFSKTILTAGALFSLAGAACGQGITIPKISLPKPPPPAEKTEYFFSGKPITEEEYHKIQKEWRENPASRPTTKAGRRDSVLIKSVSGPCKPTSPAL